MFSVFAPGLFAGKLAVVAGASSGINLQIARRLGQAGAHVVIFSRSEDKIAAAVEDLRQDGCSAEGFAQDVRDYPGVATLFERIAVTRGEIDIVISGAAGNFVAPALGMSANGFKTVVDIDLLGTFHVFRASHAHLRKPGASLISISAPQGLLPFAYQCHVNAAKAGVNSLSQTLAVEWASDGIRVNVIVPGPIGDTEGMDRLSPDPEATDALLRRIPLGRYGGKDDIAALAVFLSSEAARNITGAIMVSDGGQTLIGAGGVAAALGARDPAA
ncbi:SDR family oxidoreductase [Phenylobacterium sp. Root700]|uniref:SDR family oxidoreductase n=1 Tax=Phenylobacterium sp. Root700 TaxID=1736591 RepID=UPI0006F48709|nr:SDR family oxidoreductase [Phenylobacterium sp. Root700]KRB49625.1 short-chain dehydrogenase [Phenylobacterium sp. Root700]